MAASYIYKFESGCKSRLIIKEDKITLREIRTRGNICRQKISLGINKRTEWISQPEFDKVSFPHIYRQNRQPHLPLYWAVEINEEFPQITIWTMNEILRLMPYNSHMLINEHSGNS
ncbi:LOW QUALITY PROTEIN: hypothetical protein HZS_37 [Henneguya salminicola]|nr:LOW QUALITY PROTEIN: hypothetical protein HZS_37 [Henneguya salminicola]